MKMIKSIQIPVHAWVVGDDGITCIQRTDEPKIHWEVYRGEVLVAQIFSDNVVVYYE